MDLIQEGLKKDLVQFDNKGKYVSYRRQQKRRNYEDPEEKVQTDTYLKLVLVYGYPAERVEHFVPVRMGSETREADMIVYDDGLQKSPLIVVECKKPEVSEMEFARAVDQAFSYALISPTSLRQAGASRLTPARSTPRVIAQSFGA